MARGAALAFGATTHEAQKTVLDQTLRSKRQGANIARDFTLLPTRSRPHMGDERKTSSHCESHFSPDIQGVTPGYIKGPELAKAVVTSGSRDRRRSREVRLSRKKPPYHPALIP